MKPSLKMSSILLVTATFLFFMSPLVLSAQERPAALVVYVKGDATASTGKNSRSLVVNNLLYQGDTIKTGPDGRVSVQFSSGMICQLSEGTTIHISTLKQKAEGKSVALDLNGGGIAASVDKAESSELEVHSPTAIAGIRGTEFLVEDDGDSTTLLVGEGSVAFSTAGEEATNVAVEAGNAAVSNGKELQTRVLELFEKQKLEIIDGFESQKKDNLEAVIEQIRKNRELMDNQPSLQDLMNR